MHQVNPLSRSTFARGCFSCLPSTDCLGGCLKQAWEGLKTFFSTLASYLFCCCSPSKTSLPIPPLAAQRTSAVAHPKLGELDSGSPVSEEEIDSDEEIPDSGQQHDPIPTQPELAPVPVPVSLPFWDEISAAMLSPQQLSTDASTKPVQHMKYALQKFQNDWKVVLMGFAAGEITLTINFQPKNWAVTLEIPAQVELLKRYVHESLETWQSLFPQTPIDPSEYETILNHLSSLVELRHTARLMNVKDYVESLEKLTRSCAISLPQFQPLFAQAYDKLTSAAFANFLFDIDNQDHITLKQRIDTSFVRLSEIIQCAEHPPISFNRSSNDERSLSKLSELATSNTVHEFVESLEHFTNTFEIKLQSNQPAFVQAYNELSLASFSNFTFFLDNPTDLDRKERIDSSLKKLASIIQCEPISIELNMNTGDDGLIASILQQDHNLL